MFTHCPDCGEKFVHESAVSYTCPQCGVVSKIPITMKALNVNSVWALKIISENLYTPPTEGTYFAIHKGVKINALKDGKPINSFPSVFPTLEGLEKEERILIFDVPKFLDNGGTIFYSGYWLPEWSVSFKNKEVIVVVGKSEIAARGVAKSLSIVKAIVSLAYDKPTLNEIISSAVPLVGDTYAENISISKKGLSLKDVIEHHHMIRGRDGLRYRASINTPLGGIINDVIDWFKANGAAFLWDEENNQGYMKFKDILYRLHPFDGKFKSLMRVEGRVSGATAEGRAIMDGLSCIEDIAIKLRPETWIKGGDEKITVNQGGESIILLPKEVKLEKNLCLSYDLLQGGKKWFTPIKLEYGKEGLLSLFPGIADYFTVSPIGREIIISWLFSIFLKDFSSIRPGIRISGDWSSGKTTILQMCYWLFYGSEESELTADYTNASLWRWATVEPFLPIDNQNVRVMNDSLRTFLDVCATGGKRLIGATGGPTDFKAQKTHSFVMMSGLDEFLYGDVRTRYFEIPASNEFKSTFFPMKRKKVIFEKRNAIFTEMFELIAHDVLPNLESSINEERCKSHRILLGSKERVVDYFLIMLALGEALQRRNILPPGDLSGRWTDYIRENSERADLVNAESLEWFNNFKIALERTGLASGLQIGGESVSLPCHLVIEGNLIKGVKGSYEEVLNGLMWTANVFRRRLPWDNVRSFIVALKTDVDAIKSEGWVLKMDKKGVEIRWK